LLSFGADTDEESDPFEAGIGHMVNLDVDHDFVGKSALLAKRDSGPKRAMVGLVTETGAERRAATVTSLPFDRSLT
jgi:glycine cleavage system aminomethyltransferase T